MPPMSKLTPKKKRTKRARVSDGADERSGEEMIVERKESEQRDDDRGSAGRGARRMGQLGQPSFSEKDEMEMLEFVQAHSMVFAKEHVYYFDKVKKDRL